MLKMVVAPGGPNIVRSAVKLLEFGPKGVVVNADVYAQVRAAKHRLAIVGIARTGKSSLANMICSALAKAQVRSFAAESGTVMVTAGIFAVFVGDTAVLDCQGIRQGDSSNDKTLLLVCHAIADVFVYNQTALLDNTIFANLIQMAAFVALAERGKNRPPQLIIRIRDLTGDEFDEQAELARFLSLDYEDEYKTMRSAFAKLFQRVSVVTSDLIGKSETKTMGNDYNAFMKANPSFRTCVGEIIQTLHNAKPVQLGTFEELDAMMRKECGLTVRDLDALSSGMELAMRRFIDVYRTVEFSRPLCEGHTPCMEHVDARVAKNTAVIKQFDDQFSRVNELNYTAQRNVLHGLLTTPLFATWREIWKIALLESGFTAPAAERKDGPDYTIAKSYKLVADQVIKDIQGRLDPAPPTCIHVSKSKSCPSFIGAMKEEIKRARVLDKRPDDYAKDATARFARIDKYRNELMKNRIASILIQQACWVSKFAASVTSLINLEYDKYNDMFAKFVTVQYPPPKEGYYSIGLTITEGVNNLECKAAITFLDDLRLPPSAQLSYIPPNALKLPEDTTAVRAVIAKQRRIAYGDTVLYTVSDLHTSHFNALEDFFDDLIVGLSVADMGMSFVVYALHDSTPAQKLNAWLNARSVNTLIIGRILEISQASLFAQDRKFAIDGHNLILDLRRYIATGLGPLVEFTA